MIKGTYRFYQDGELVGTSENLLTTAGKRAILLFLAGRGGSIGGALAVGTGVTPVTLLDNRLTFEADRVTIENISSLFNDSLIVFKTTIPQEKQYTIYEAGLFNITTNPNSASGSRLLTSFETNLETWTAGTYSTLNSRIGVESLRLQPAASGTIEAVLPVAMDLGYFTPDDVFTIAFFKNSTNASSLILKFRDISNNVLSLTKSISALANGYNVVSFRKGDFVATGTITWDGIASIAVAHSASAGGASDIFLDGIRAEDDDSQNTDYALISRSILPSPLIKSTAAPMDIEYALELTFV